MTLCRADQCWGTGDYQFLAVNEGVGPAKIRSVRLTVDGQPVATWNAAVRALTGAGDSTLTYGSFRRGTVLPAGATRVLLTLNDGEQATKFWAEGQKRMRSVVCYCSVYDECWTSDSDEPEPQAIDGCRIDAATEFTQ